MFKFKAYSLSYKHLNFSFNKSSYPRFFYSLDLPHVSSITRYNKSYFIHVSKRAFFEKEPETKRSKYFVVMTVPKYFVESFRKKLDINEIKEELLVSLEEDVEKEMTPTKIKEELDKYIVGQDNVKRSIAIALRNRYRKRLLTNSKMENLRSHNILISGKSGSGKTEVNI